jgi:DNA-binding transcriptional LysR family regulator
LRRLFEAKRADLRQQLVLASGAYLFAHHLPDPVRQFRSAWPSVQLSLRVAAWSALHRLMERGEADLAVLACDPDVPRSSYLEYEHLFDEKLTLMVPTGHSVARRKRIAPVELLKHPLILPPKGGADRKVLDRFFRKHNLIDRLNTALVCGLVDVAKHYVTRGVGIALMYVTDHVGQCTPGLELRSLDAEIEPLPIEMAVLKGAHLPTYVDAFRRMVRESLSDKQSSAKG